jgi:ParB family chromosome partitioning protein
VAKRTLGRGLSNLLPGADSAGGKPVVRDNPNYQEIPLNEIRANPKQPRKHFNEADIKELAKTLHTVGLIEPVVVRKVDEHYQLISGERRFRAAGIAGFKKIPAVIKQVNDVQALEMGIIENIQREELGPVEEARAYEYWMNETGRKASDLADKVGKDRTTITNLIRLLKLPTEVLDLVEQRMLTPGQARPLLGIGDRKLLGQLAIKIAREGWTARKVEDEISRLTDGPRAARATGKIRDPNIKHLEDRLRTKFTTRVQITHKKTGAGKISIAYASLEDLERLIELWKIK